MTDGATSVAPAPTLVIVGVVMEVGAAVAEGGDRVGGRNCGC